MRSRPGLSAYRRQDMRSLSQHLVSAVKAMQQSIISMPIRLYPKHRSKRAFAEPRQGPRPLVHHVRPRDVIDAKCNTHGSFSDA